MSLHFDITGDNSNFLRKLDEARNGIRSTSKQIEESGTSIEQMFGRMAKGAAALGAGFSAQQFASQVMKVRGEFQQLEVAFNTMLGSEEKANALMQQLVKTAATTPFDLQSVAGGAKQLLAYGTAAEDVNGTLVRLGDIAAGLSIPLGDLVYLYGTTMSQGRLYTQDLNQFTGRGIPMIGELAKQFGVAESEVKKLVESGKVGFPEVQKVIESLTNEGGKFGGLMEAQSKTITGQISNIEDSISTMYNNIGKQSEGFINDALSGVSYLVENYEDIGKTVLELAATYGVYKAVLMSVAAYQSVATGITYSVEIAELSKLIPLKQQSANEDVIAAVASGKLTQSKADQVIALRAEIAAKIQSLQATKAQAQAEFSSALATYKASRLRYTVAQEQVALAQSQMSIAIKSGTVEEIAAAKKNAQTASLELNNAAVAKNTAHKGVNIAATNSKSASEALNTVQTGLNTVSQNTNTISTNILTAAKTKLAAASKALGLSMLANPYVLVTAAVVGLGYGIYKLVTAETELDKAHKRLNDATSDVEKGLASEVSKLTSLERKLAETKKGTEEYNTIKKTIVDNYGQYYKGLDGEIERVGNLSTVYGKLVEAMRMSIGQRKFESFFKAEQDNLDKTIGEKLDKAYDTLIEKYGKDKGGKLYQQVFDYAVRGVSMSTDTWKELTKASFNFGLDNVTGLVLDMNRATQASNKSLEEIKEKYQITGEEITKIISGSNSNQDKPTENKTLKQLLIDIDASKTKIKELQEQANKGLISSDKIKEEQDVLSKLTSDYKNRTGFEYGSTKQESAAEKLRKEQEKYNLLLDEQKRVQERMKTDSLHELEQIEINGLVEGSEKNLRQRELNHMKELEAIKRETEDKKLQAIEAERKTFEANPSNEKRTFDADKFIKSESAKIQFASFDKTAEAKTKTENTKYNRGDDLKGLLDEYQDYTDKRLAIETKYNNDLATLEEQRKQAVKDGNTKKVEQIDRAKTQATKNKGKELMSMDYDKLKESPEYVRAFENLKRTSSETLNSLLSQLENAKQTAAQVLSPNELREYTTTIQEIMDELDSRNPFQALIDRKSELAEAENALAIASAQLDAVQNRGAKIETGAKNIRLNEKTGKIESEKTYLSATEALKKYNEAKDEAVNANAKVEEAERKVDDVMGELFDSIKNVGSAIGGEAGEIIGIIGDVGQFALMAMDGVETASITAATAVQAVEKASVILAIIGAAIQIATKIASLFNGTDYMEEFRKEMAKLNYELELAKLNAEISTDEKSIFGDDLWGNAIKNVDLANDALSRYNDTLDQIANRKKYTGFIGAMADAKGLKNTYDSLGDSIANMQLKIRHKTWFRSAKYASLKDAVPELFNEDGSINQAALEEFIGSDTFEKLSQENQKYLQEMSDYWKAYQDSVEQVKDYLSDIFGDLGGTLTDTLVDAFANGTDAAQAFTDSVSEMLEQMGKQMIFHAVFKDIFEKTQQQMLDVTQNENLSDDDKFKEYVDILGGMTDEVMGEQDKFNALLEAYQKMAAEKGIDIFKPSDSSKETLDSFVSQMQSAFTSLDVTAKDVSDNIYDYFRQAMVNALYEKEYKSKMEELYKSFEDKSADGLSESDMAQLGTQVDQYINEMLKGVEGINSLFADKLKDAADIQSFVDNVKSAMSSIEATAEDVTDNIFEYIRQQMVDKMFADTFQPQIEEFYKKVQAAMSDGSVTDSEKDALRKEAEKLANDITSAKDILSDTLGVTADNLKKEAEAEFKSFSDGILSSLYSAEVTAESIAKNIADSMRQELIKAMYIEQYEPRIRAIWDKWKEYSSDGLVTDEERASIKDDINDLSKEVADAAKDISDAWTEAGDAVYDTFESFSNSIKSVLQNAETTAEDVAKNIYQFMRNALVNSMFAEQVQPQIKAWYDKYAEYMKDGAIDTTERKILDEMIAEIQKAGMEIVDAANGLFPSLDTGAIQEVENAKQEWESFSDSMLNSLYDIEASAGDISDDMSEYMRKALIKAMYVNNYKPQMQKWYDEWQRAMGDDIITSEEKQTLDSMKQEMLEGMKKEADAINQMFDSMYSQEASSKGFEGMSQDTGEELNGRFTALQSSNEEIKNSMLSMLSSMNLLSVSTNSNGITLTEIRNIMISSNGHLEDISKYTRTLLDVGSKLDSINKSIQKAL